MNPAFSAWLKGQTRFADVPAVIADVFVSRSDNLGESDLIVIYTRDDGLNFAVLIEDKVDAPLQPDQASRYRLRAEREISSGKYNDFTVILCAPISYLANSLKAAEFDTTVSFEDIAAFFLVNGDTPRCRYRASFLLGAGTRRVNNWERQVDDITEVFWSAAYAVAIKEFPILEMKPLKVTKDSTWINFRPRDMPTMPHRIYVSVKGERGYMDLTFSDAQVDLFHGKVAHLLDPDMSVHKTGKSSAIRLQTDGFMPREGLEAAIPKARAAFAACARLIRFYRAHRAELDAATTSAATPPN
ncbi:hypothetical protein [Methylobacterium bullatum]|uniref:Uncharacterized protein n=1 Tax=Methylobacterium bullatum TaxID=570505 RepID=A0AAV4ZDW4_9HYPH|nr:hypothetical protein [Methylobacterium bullatum]GJD42012.1 hypothetical protein OICFNHDK_4503 [Methylobacterium bullatum]